METLTRLLFIVSLACIGWLSYRLDSASTELATLRADKLQAAVTLQAIEKQHAQRLEKINAESQTKLDAVQRNLDAANRADYRMRQQLATFAKRDNPAGTATTEECSAVGGRIDLLAILLAELDGMAGEYAQQADESRTRGLACELSYEAAK